MLSIYESEIRKLNTSLTQNKQTHSQLKTEINQTRNALEQAKVSLEQIQQKLNNYMLNYYN